MLVFKGCCLHTNCVQNSVFTYKIHKTTPPVSGQGTVGLSLSKNENEMRGYLLFFPKSFDSSIACFQWLVIIFQLVDRLLGLE